MRTAIAILAVLIGLAASGYAWHLHNQPRLPFFEPHRTFQSEGRECAAWRVEQFVVILCEDQVAVLYPKKKSGYST